MDEGSCRHYTLRWYFHPATNTCRPFIFGGCQGNSNRFETKRKCERRCKTSAGEKIPLDSLILQPGGSRKTHPGSVHLRCLMVCHQGPGCKPQQDKGNSAALLLLISQDDRRMIWSSMGGRWRGQMKRGEDLPYREKGCFQGRVATLNGRKGLEEANLPTDFSRMGCPAVVAFDIPKPPGSPIAFPVHPSFTWSGSLVSRSTSPLASSAVPAQIPSSPS
ncbi:hypothetical protein CIB84_014393 [Bambusicola thoracicus]|uniref:BPTI/Kunitz inhibitor domain-containing protein n=1 Tax=Bambusicola thoracicus TaxID=9083 RepID=A0A2P4SCQ0_BAMTH|nr:hypothetical protein CIB84_014393 [Bambusicola thoracicus]